MRPDDGFAPFTLSLNWSDGPDGGMGGRCPASASSDDNGCTGGLMTSGGGAGAAAAAVMSRPAAAYAGPCFT